MPCHDMLVLGASAGGVGALSKVVSGFPADLPAAVFIVQHVAPFGTSAMPAILSRSGPLEAVHPRDGEAIEPGRIYIAPPDHHLVIEPGRVRTSRAPTENGHRPAVDVLFRTAARTYGPRVTGVVLTGNLDDGTAGLAEIKKKGGLAVVQDPSTADYTGMPTNAIAGVDVDHVAPLGDLSALLVQLVQQPVVEPSTAPADPPAEVIHIKDALERGEDREGNGRPSDFTCPDCGGTLWESVEPGVVYFRCRTGHGFSPESLLAGQFDSLEGSLWAAVRSLEENAALARRMERWMSQRENLGGVRRYDLRAREAEQHAAAIRQILLEESRHGGEEDEAVG